ncbi:diphthine methyl ester synthase-like [Centruroides sculpturatus]|uniref:diphthine methyl ester synthase-like n=1 Tax=Centruroides sculpturatus TaxID=218467 RepID=UPI000C6D8E4C|nr:diphthine methyl ester synthase-like [Centruroides sculpturatus]
MLFLVGLGLGNAEDITIKGLEIVKKADRVYLEAYTSILTVGKEELEKFYGKEIILADREMVEQESDSILEQAKSLTVAFLVVGDPFGATTHTDLVLRAVESKIPYKVVHNASILNAVGCCGLQLYNYGETVSIVFWTETWKPDSFYDKIEANRKRGLHTLCLLDIKMKEQSIENLMRGKKIYEPPRFMTVNQAAEQLLEIIERKLKAGCSEMDLAYDKETICVGIARLGSENQKILTLSLENMKKAELGDPLHSLIITGNLHPLELDMLKIFADDQKWFELAVEKYVHQ